MGNMINIIGLKVGTFTVISRHHTHESGHIYWSCRCECGDIKLVRGVRLRNGEGIRCLTCDPTQEKKYAYEIKNKFEYRLKYLHRAMHDRCNNKSRSYYKFYGGKGIKVCAEWSSFSVFKKWALAHGYGQKLSIDRIDSNGNYSPDNCKWSTNSEQAKNKDRAIRMPNGEFAKDYCEKHGVPYMTFYNRYKVYKWDIEKSATYPVKKTPRWHTEDGTIKKDLIATSKSKKSLVVIAKEQPWNIVSPTVLSTNKVESTNEWET